MKNTWKQEKLPKINQLKLWKAIFGNKHKLKRLKEQLEHLQQILESKKKAILSHNPSPTSIIKLCGALELTVFDICKLELQISLFLQDKPPTALPSSTKPSLTKTNVKQKEAQQLMEELRLRQLDDAFIDDSELFEEQSQEWVEQEVIVSEVEDEEDDDEEHEDDEDDEDDDDDSEGAEQESLEEEAGSAQARRPKKVTRKRRNECQEINKNKGYVNNVDTGGNNKGENDSAELEEGNNKTDAMKGDDSANMTTPKRQRTTSKDKEQCILIDSDSEEADSAGIALRHSGSMDEPIVLEEDYERTPQSPANPAEEEMTKPITEFIIEDDNDEVEEKEGEGSTSEQDEGIQADRKAEQKRKEPKKKKKRRLRKNRKRRVSDDELDEILISDDEEGSIEVDDGDANDDEMEIVAGETDETTLQAFNRRFEEIQKNLSAESKAAQQKENERQECIREKRKLNETVVSSSSGVMNISINDKPVLVHSKLASQLKPHQKEAVLFLWENICYQNGMGCILAHEMGLGKTFALISFLHTLCISNGTKTERILILIPAFLVDKWCEEFQKWLGDLDNQPINVYSIRDCVPAERPEVINNWFTTGGVLLLSYHMYAKLVKDKNMNYKPYLQDPGPDVVTLDEGQKIKNNKGDFNQAVSMIKTNKRIILTASPVQNNLTEYWSLINFVRPGFWTLTEWSALFSNPIEEGLKEDKDSPKKREAIYRVFMLNKISKYLSGFLHRRRFVAKALPPKTEFLIFCGCSSLQGALYDSVLKADFNTTNPHFTTKTFVRLILAHPLLIHHKLPPTPQPVVTSYEWADKCLSSLKEAEISKPEQSGKITILLCLVEQCLLATPDKIIVFSSFVKHLEIIQRCLRQRRIRNLLYHGNLPNKDEARAHIIEECNSRHDGDGVRVFLLSTKACGLGLDLYGANRVIMFEPEDNPTHNDQAAARVYRWGQKKQVFIYHLVTKGSMEERIAYCAHRKTDLSQRVIDEGGRIEKHLTLVGEDSRPVVVVDAYKNLDLHEVIEEPQTAEKNGSQNETEVEHEKESKRRDIETENATNKEQAMRAEQGEEKEKGQTKAEDSAASVEGDDVLKAVLSITNFIHSVKTKEAQQQQQVLSLGEQKEAEEHLDQTYFEQKRRERRNEKISCSSTSFTRATHNINNASNGRNTGGIAVQEVRYAAKLTETAVMDLLARVQTQRSNNSSLVESKVAPPPPTQGACTTIQDAERTTEGTKEEASVVDVGKGVTKEGEEENGEWGDDLEIDLDALDAYPFSVLWDYCNDEGLLQDSDRDGVSKEALMQRIMAYNLK
ncbi:AAA ATPase containing von Willebrand factor type A (VWA)-like domain [Balamuthia mandrillaris]